LVSLAYQYVEIKSIPLDELDTYAAHISIEECSMTSTLSRPIPVSRDAVSRLGDAAVHAVLAMGSALRAALERLQEQRHRAQQLQALRRLSPHVLHDIGAPHEWINEAARWREEHDCTRDSFLRNL
jgi:uncharacterized protein YjiS (DUF1127 family)